jgi:hypothetical protein
MPGSVKARLVYSMLLAAFAALAIAGCGGGGGDEEGGSADPATLAPPETPLYVDATIQPEGATKANIEALAREIAGVDDLGGLIASKLEESAVEDGEEIDFEKELEPWLGEKAAVFFPEYVEEDFDEGVGAVQVTDAGEAEQFIDRHASSYGEDGSYEGVDFKVDDDGQTTGLVDGLLVTADSEALFKRVVDTAGGKSLADEDAFTEAIANVPDDSAADVYVDIGGLIEQSGGEIDPEALAFLEGAGFEPREATAVASAIPGANQIEIDLSTNLSGDNPPAGDASQLLATLPADSFAAFTSPEFGKRFEEALDRIDENGIAGEVPPHQLKKAFKEEGIDIESITSSIGDLGFFVEGSSERDLTGALVIEADDPTQAKNTVSNLGLLLRASGIPGISAVHGAASGFSIRSPDMGSQSVVVLAKGSRIAVGYGRASATAVLREGGETLADSPAYKEAVSALGDTPISGFVDGPAALKFASSMIAPDEAGFAQAKPYLSKIAWAALGNEVADGLAKAKLIVGVGK